MQKIAAFIVKKRKLLLVAMLILAVVCAALMPFVGVNTDMTKYLPNSSQMKIGMDHMNEAFPDAVQTYTIRVMFRGLDAREKLAIREQLAEIPNVQSVAYEPDSSDYNRDDATLYKLSTLYDYNSDEEAQIERDVAERFAGYDVAVRSDDTSAPSIPPIVFVLSIVLVTTILLIACPSYFEPVLFLLTIGVAVLLNQGTNIFLCTSKKLISLLLQISIIHMRQVSTQGSAAFCCRCHRYIPVTDCSYDILGHCSLICCKASQIISGFLIYFHCLLQVRITIGYEIALSRLGKAAHTSIRATLNTDVNPQIIIAHDYFQNTECTCVRIIITISLIASRSCYILNLR